MKFRRRRSATKPSVFLIGVLALASWLFGNHADKEPTKDSSKPIEQVAATPTSKPNANGLEITTIPVFARLEQDTSQTTDQTWVYVTGSDVNMRDLPDMSGWRMAVYSRPTRLAYIEKRGE